MELDVLVPFQPTLTLKAYANRFGDVYVDLYSDATILRKLHSHEDHRNPGGLLVPGTHMHFPTRQFPMTRKRSSYAYELNVPIDTVSEGVRFVCGLLSIGTDGIQRLLGE